MIKYQSAFHSIGQLCKVISVSRSGYYSWLTKRPSQQAVVNEALSVDINRIFHASRKTYGVPRIQKVLEYEGKYHEKIRISRLMKDQGLKAKAAKIFKVTTNSRHNKAIASNVLAQQFNPLGPNQAWAADITYVPTHEGRLYLGTVIDLYSRSIIDWSMEKTMKTQLIKDALDMAVKRRKPKAGVIHHSDRGSQYCSDEYQFQLAKNGFVCSMSAAGNCYDNAVMESFYHSLKVEMIHGAKYQTRDEAKQAIFYYIEIFYNRQRLHSTLGYKTPMQFEMAA